MAARLRRDVRAAGDRGGPDHQERIVRRLLHVQVSRPGTRPRRRPQAQADAEVQVLVGTMAHRPDVATQ